MKDKKILEFQKELEKLLNRYSMENYWDMPDFIMSEFITDMILNTSNSMKTNLKWHGK